MTSSKLRLTDYKN